MNPLPQRKKSPEEIAKLRESLGVPLAPETSGTREDLPPPMPRPAAPVVARPAEPAPPIPAPVHALPKGALLPRAAPVRQHHISMEVESSSPPAESPPTSPPAVILTSPSQRSRPVHSLKRSELSPAPDMAPVPVLQPLSTDYKLPTHRHSDQELAETRRRDALTVLSHGGYKLPKATHPAVLAIAYVLAIGGAAAPKMLEWTSLLTNDYALSHAMGSGYHLLIGCTLASLPIAAYIQFKQSLSRHHATFIAAIVFFALVFAALHYFPQLRYAT